MDSVIPAIVKCNSNKCNNCWVGSGMPRHVQSSPK